MITAAAILLVVGCGDSDGALEAAQASFLAGSLDAYAAYQAIDPTTEDGRRARALLADADVHYREGIARLDRDDESGMAELARGLRIAPIDPALYLPLARAFARRGEHERAGRWYAKYYRSLPPESPAALRAIDEYAALPLDPDVRAELDALALAPRATPSAPVSTERAVAVGALVGALVVALVALLVVRVRQRGASLDRIAAERPELHPAIAYLVGSLRHELLKHRIGAASDAIAALRRGRPTDAELAFLRSRLFGGEPLEQAFASHVRAFERTLGTSLVREPRFARAAGAIRRLGQADARLARGDARAVEVIGRAHAELKDIDAELAALGASLVRTVVTRSFLDAALAEVRAEHEAGAIRLDDVHVELDEAIAVEMFRFDLTVVLKNVIRNAVLAMGASKDGPRRLGLRVGVDLLPTGEETVSIHVLDTSPEPLRTEDIYERDAHRGLGLVTAALSRYNGAISVDPGRDGYAKSVTISLFAALHGAPTSEAAPSM